VRWRDPVYRLIVRIGSAYFRLLGLRRTVRGTEHVPASGGAVLAISHFSYLDFALAEWAVWGDRKRYTRFMATAASFRHRLAGPVMRAMGHIPVERDVPDEAFTHAVAELHKGEMVGVFPEGRVSATFTLLPFKSGAVRMAAAAGVPVVPCVIWGSHRVMTRTRKVGFWQARRTPVTILFGPAQQVLADDDPAVATGRLRTAMEELLEQAHDTYPELPPGAWWVPAHRGGGAPSPTTDEATSPR
jgi:1-acyl-sn-glycerol-3-phosphate acyltransferase